MMIVILCLFLYRYCFIYLCKAVIKKYIGDERALKNEEIKQDFYEQCSFDQLVTMWKRTNRTILRVEQRALFEKAKDFVEDEEIEVYSKTL